MIYMSFFVGLLLICRGGDWFVDAASFIARAFGIPKYIIGATIVSFATTMPEILVSVAAALKGSSVMAMGNAVGSVSANTGIILGVSLFCLPAVIQRKEYLTKNILYIGCLILLFIAFRDRIFDAGDSVFLLLGGVLFLIMNVKNAMTGRLEKEAVPVDKKELRRRIFFFFFGAACVVTGSELLIDSACVLARQFHISEEIISVTILAMGTSLPEFVTTITAIVKKESSLSVGNIVGANVIDTAFILPICTLITGESLSVAPQMAQIDMPVCILLSVIALTPMMVRGRIRRIDGAAVFVIYLIYFFIITTGQ
ncbi:MAG TPA: calcium/sodium antiporter [Candidatus Anaerobutyricum stercoris]|uniref:Calcium/sodium antiporter n=1 Tax=Candidatus Anaerobutyricum stercoris TaxID=2838457 RepID=A0A9D2EJS1_9FIRM|nr:Inner membrane protein YrbG [Eubacteriaceae bacterium CHKCI004]HIZ38914.1 calcium/sodium antiporter [Candidatus Anaerobutyricum stercoris]